ncbi:MAG: PKD domain-containing protein, partial [Nanoarchaeota archaeon]
MKKLNLLLSLILTVILFSGNAFAVEVGMEWQDGSNEITINYGDSVSFEANAGSIKMPLSVSLVLMNENILHVYEDFDNYYDYLYGNKYLVTKDHYKNARDYVIHIEATDGIGDTKINELILHVFEAKKDDNGEVIINNPPVVNDIITTEDNGLFSFEIIASDADGDEIKEYESRVVAKGVEYSAFCENNICIFDSKDPTNDGFETIRFDDEAIVKARAYDGKNWGNWYEESLVIDNRDTVAEEEGRHTPVLDEITDKEIFENSALIFNVGASDEDNDIVLLDANGLPEGASFENGVFNWKPDYNAVQHGGIIDGVLRFISLGILGDEPSSNFEVNFYVVDNRGNYDIEKVKIKVKDINRLPALEVSDISVNEGELVKVIPEVSDPDNDKIKLIFSAPLNSNGEWQTDFNDAGTYIITVTADDSYNGIVRKNLNINVADLNRAPVIDSISGIREVFEGDLVELVVNAHDDDNDGLRYSTDSNLFSQNGNIFRWKTEIGNKGTYSVNFQVEDGKNGIDSENVNIIVKEKINNVPAAEIIKPEKDLTVNVGDSAEFIGRGEDSDGSIEEYNWIMNGVKVSDKDRFTYTFDKEGTHIVEFSVKDNRGKWSETDSVSIKVEREIIILNSAPVIESVSGAREVFAGDVVELVVNARDTDNDDLTYGITGNLFSQSESRFTWRTS